MLGIQTGGLWIRSPYDIQRKIPETKIMYIGNEMLLVFRVLMICNAWGTNEIVVKAPAMRPMTAII